MRVIGVTGGLGSGKTTVAGMFKDLGAKILDADKIARRQLLPKGKCFKAVIKVFGKNIVTSGKIDRKRVADRVFKDLKKLRQLEQIIHPEVRKEIIKKIQNYKVRKRKTVIVLDVPLLFESKFHRHVDISIVVKASKAVQVARATKLLGMTKAEAQRRIKAQMPLRKKIRLADMIIDNQGSLIQTKKQVKLIWEKIW